MQLFSVELTGGPQQSTASNQHEDATHRGVVGIDVARRVVRDEPQIVVQLLLDDEVEGFDRSLLDAPIIAELIDVDGHAVAREPFDHHAFRQRLRDELAAGQQVTRGVLVLDRGELLPPWIRLAFLPFELADFAGHTLSVRRTTKDDLVAGVDSAYSAGELTDHGRTAMLTSIEQRYPS